MPPRSRARILEERGQLGLGFSTGEMTRLPTVDWRPPRVAELPDRLGGIVGIDTEECDEGLASNQGPGWAWRGGGRVVGYSIAADNFEGYIPLSHDGGDNVDDPDQARRWLRHVLGDPSQKKLFANAMYDIGWAEVDGVEIAGEVRDVQLVEALLDEHRFSYELDAIAKSRVGRGKSEAVLREAARAHGLDPKRDISRLPARFVAEYATDDAVLARDVWLVQEPIIAEEGLGTIVALEHDLLPMYLDMRSRGVRIDVPYVEKFRDNLVGQVASEIAEVKRLTGLDVSPWEARSVARVLDEIGVRYGTTRTGEPSVTHSLLEKTRHPAAQALLRAREKDKLRGTFLEGQILGQLHHGRVHGSIHPLKSDEGGTVTGRLSMSNPNLQFIPTRTEEGRLVRCAFLPEEGQEWASLDFSQQEVRLLIHFAVLCRMQSAIDAAARYETDPGLNYHEFVAEITSLVYKAAKILNFAIIYGRGVKETAIQLDKTPAETKQLFDQHAAKMPFARRMSYKTRDRVNEIGYLTTLLGRRQRFPLYEPADWDARDGRMYPIEVAKNIWPGQELVRARIHKALNALIQPSAADQTKKAMLDVWRAGYGGMVMAQIHDELDCSISDRRDAIRIAEIMRDAVPLKVPNLVDVEFGLSWGDCK